MSEKEFDTLYNFVNSNNSFYDALKNKTELKIDTYITFELLLLYFKMNYEYISKLSNNDSNMLYDILKNNNFTIENNNIIYKIHSYSITYFLTLLNIIENYKNKLHSDKIINVSFKPKETSSKKTFPSKVIDLTLHQRNVYFTMKEREYIFEKNIIVDEITLPFILSSNKYFKELLNYLILLLLNKKQDNFNYQYIEILYSYVALYPFVGYANGKQEISFKDLNLPQNEIGLKKSTYKKDGYLECLENDMQELSNKCQRLKFQRQNMKSNSPNYEARLSRIDEHINAIESKKLDNYYSQYIYKHTNEIYNPNIFEFITKSFEQGNIYINEYFENPVIKLFYIDNNEVLFYCAMHLSTLGSLCDSKVLLPEQPESKNLKKVT